MPRVIIGLGSNVGVRLLHLRVALARLRELAPSVRASSIYESAPVGGPPQDDFLNLAALFEWPHDLSSLLDALQKIERDLGRDREREQRWGPRPIDLDVLWVESVVLATDRLEIPHPRLHERAFALLPLLELAPEARDPRTGIRFAEVAAALEDAQRVRKLAIETDVTPSQ